MVLSLTLWFVYFVSVLGLPTVPTTYQVNTVPGGVMFFVIVALTCKCLGMRSKQSV